MSGQCKNCKHYVTLWKYLLTFPLGNYYHKCGFFYWAGKDVGPVWGMVYCRLNDLFNKCKFFIEKKPAFCKVWRIK